MIAAGRPVLYPLFIDGLLEEFVVAGGTVAEGEDKEPIMTSHHRRTLRLTAVAGDSGDASVLVKRDRVSESEVVEPPSVVVLPERAVVF